MHLLPAWKTILRKAWSVKLAGVAALLSGVEAAMQQIAPSVSNGKFAMAAAVVGALAMLARVVAQTKMFEDDEEPQNAGSQANRDQTTAQ